MNATYRTQLLALCSAILLPNALAAQEVHVEASDLVKPTEETAVEQADRYQGDRLPSDQRVKPKAANPDELADRTKKPASDEGVQKPLDSGVGTNPIAMLSKRWTEDALELTLHRAADEIFFGVILVSFDAGQQHYFEGLPPILNEYAVLAAGFANGELSADIALEGLERVGFYAQGLIADGWRIETTAVMEV